MYIFSLFLFHFLICRLIPHSPVSSRHSLLSVSLPSYPLIPPSLPPSLSPSLSLSLPPSLLSVSLPSYPLIPPSLPPSLSLSPSLPLPLPPSLPPSLPLSFPCPYPPIPLSLPLSLSLSPSLPLSLPPSLPLFFLSEYRKLKFSNGLPPLTISSVIQVNTVIVKIAFKMSFTLRTHTHNTPQTHLQLVSSCLRDFFKKSAATKIYFSGRTVRSLSSRQRRSSRVRQKGYLPNTLHTMHLIW